MENNLMEIGKRFYQLKSEMLHGGYTGEMLENHIIDVISDEILSELGEIEINKERSFIKLNIETNGWV